MRWLPDVPEGWVLSRIKFDALVKGRIGWHGLSTADYRDEGCHLVTGTDLVAGRVDWQSCVRVDEEIYQRDPHIQLRNGDVLVTKDGTIGKVAVVESIPGPSTLNSGLFRVTPALGTLDPRFLYWVLDSLLLRQFILFRSSGSTIRHLYQDDFVNMPYLRAPLPMQRAIADFLDRETTRMDSLIDKKRALVRKARERVRALSYSLIGDPLLGTGPIPRREWQVLPLRRVLTQMKTGGTPPTADADHYLGGDVPWFGPSSIGKALRLLDPSKFIAQSAIDSGAAPLFPADSTLVVCIGATAGRVAHLDGTGSANQQITCLTANSLVIPRFLSWQLWSLSDLLRGLASRTTLPIITNDFLRDFRVAVPPLEEQRRIIDTIETAARQLDHFTQTIERQVHLLSEHRQALVTAAVTGRVEIQKGA